MKEERTAEGACSIAAAIQEAEPFKDAVEELLVDAASNPGAPFDPDALVLLKNLRKNDRARFEAVHFQLRKLKVRVTELDKLLSGPSDPDNRHANFSGGKFEDVPPAQEAVDGAQLLDEISVLLQRYLVLPPHAADAIALWIVFAHCHDLWQISPRLAFLSPEKRCGKSTALSILQSLVPRPLSAANITAAAVFRSVEKFRPTLVIDEADTFLAGRDELRGVLNSGHSRSNANVIRLVGDHHEPMAFSTWAPLVIAMIGELPDTLDDRSIIIPLKRKAAHEKVERLRLDRLQELGAPLKQRIARWVLDHRDELVRWDREVPPALNDRASDNWRPLLAIADNAGEGWGERARAAALALSTRNDDQSPSVLLLADIVALFDADGSDRLASQIIIERLLEMDDRPWPELSRGRPISSSQVSKLLRPFGIRSRTIRFQYGATAKGYLRRDFEDAFSRYIPNRPVTPLQANKNNEVAANSAVTPEGNVTAQEQPKAVNKQDCYGVTASGATPPGERLDEQLALPLDEKRIRRTI